MKLEVNRCQRCGILFKHRSHLLQHERKHTCPKKLLPYRRQKPRSLHGRQRRQQTYFSRKKRFLTARKRRMDKVKLSAFFSNLHKEITGHLTSSKPQILSPEQAAHSSKSYSHEEDKQKFKFKDVIIRLNKIDAYLNIKSQQNKIPEILTVNVNQDGKKTSIGGQSQGNKPPPGKPPLNIPDTAVVRLHRLSFALSQHAVKMTKDSHTSGVRSKKESSPVEEHVKVRLSSSSKFQTTPLPPEKEEYLSLCKSMSLCIPKLKLHLTNGGVPLVQDTSTKKQVSPEVSRLEVKRSIFDKKPPESCGAEHEESDRWSNMEMSTSASSSSSDPLNMCKLDEWTPIGVPTSAMSSNPLNMCKPLRISIPKLDMSHPSVFRTTPSSLESILGSGQPCVQTCIDKSYSSFTDTGPTDDQNSITELPSQSMDFEASPGLVAQENEPSVCTSNKLENICKDVKVCLPRIDSNLLRPREQPSSVLHTQYLHRTTLSAMEPVVKLHRISPFKFQGRLPSDRISHSNQQVHDVSSCLSESLNRLHIGSSCNTATSSYQHVGITGESIFQEVAEASISVSIDDGLVAGTQSYSLSAGTGHSSSNIISANTCVNPSSTQLQCATHDNETIATSSSSQLPLAAHQHPVQMSSNSSPAPEELLQPTSVSPQAPVAPQRPPLPRLAITLDRVNVEEFYLNNPGRRGLGLPVQYVLDQQRPLPQPRVNRNTQLITINA
ncbi:uncharacterized protein LOC106156404 [Lingula anatina]|uniref:Uncharacterized protein LOC106156404 n=1 Tax=Lingula anatina TaxID=7574 RepID=A0A1S3HNJ3_LINAN|nr:uncharacterized protein LOC106156404 [Lingula anatina]|eukprot:XP_013387101.1 uncharacterized protein LOC106156404 [Lingula anatina]